VLSGLTPHGRSLPVRRHRAAVPPVADRAAPSCLLRSQQSNAAVNPYLGPAVGASDEVYERILRSRSTPSQRASGRRACTGKPNRSLNSASRTGTSTLPKRDVTSQRARSAARVRCPIRLMVGCAAVRQWSDTRRPLPAGSRLKSASTPTDANRERRGPHKNRSTVPGSIFF
jgi:hypothetical protein